MKHNLFLVHGMGVHDNDSWTDEVKNKLQEVASRYEYFQDKNIQDHVNFFPISYDEKLRELLDIWKENADDMRSFFEENDIKEDFNSDKILSWFSNANELEKNFFWSHISDVLIYKFFITYQASIRSHVALQFVKGINWIKENNPDHQTCTIISHSLGNIVAHDALHMLGTSQFDEHDAFTPEDWLFHAGFSLANVSRIMETDFDPYESIIRPSSAGGDAYLNLFVNVNHMFDPFTVPKRFSQNSWGSDYLEIKLNHYHDWNIHGFTHFIDNPRLHIPLLRTIIDLSCVSHTEIEESFQSYDSENQFGGNLKCIGDIKTIVNSRLKPLVQNINNELEIEDMVPILVKGYKIYEEIRRTVEECDEII